MNEGGSERRYGDREVGLILKRATELQKRAPELPDARGLTLAELEDVAREAGIDPRFLRRAADELERPGVSHAGLERVLGGPVTIELEREVDGEVSTDAFEAMVHAIQVANNGPGQASVVGGTFSWTSQTQPNQKALLIAVRAKDGRTRIRIEERLGQVATGGFVGGVVGGGVGVGLGVGLGVGVGALGSALFATAFPLAVVGGTYWIARAWWKRYTAARQHHLLDLLDTLTTIAHEDLAARALASGDSGEPR